MEPYAAAAPSPLDWPPQLRGGKKWGTQASWKAQALEWWTQKWGTDSTLCVGSSVPLDTIDDTKTVSMITLTLNTDWGH